MQQIHAGLCAALFNDSSHEVFGCWAQVAQATARPVGMQEMDEFGNAVLDDDMTFVVCEAVGPEVDSVAKVLPLNVKRSSTEGGVFMITLFFSQPGVFAVSCYIVRRGGLNARYYNNRWLEGTPVDTPVNPNINFLWGEGLVSGDSAELVSANWDGYLQIDESALYTFIVQVR